MPRSSRHKSHRHSKHSSRDAREYSDSEEDVKMRDLNKDEGLARVSRYSGSSEKRKDPTGHSSSDVAEEYLVSKRTKEKERDREKGNVSAVLDRWDGGGGGGGVVVESEMKGESSKAKSGVDSKSRSSEAHDGGVEKKEESKSGGKIESKRKYEKESLGKEKHQGKDSKESREKPKVLEKEEEKGDKVREKEKEKERERRAKDSEREVEDEVVDIGDSITPLVGFDNEQECRHGKENNVWPMQDERKLESEKELDKQRRKRDGSYERDKYQDDVRGSGERRVSSRGERSKDVKYRDEKYKDGSYGDKHREDSDRDARYKDEKYVDDVDRERRYREAKYRESSGKVSRHKDDKFREDVDRDKRLRDEKYREGGDRDNKYRDAKYREDADKDYRRRVDKYHEDGDRDDRHRDYWYYEDGSRETRTREEKNWEDVGRDGRRREGKQRDDSSVKDRRVHDIKYQDEWLVRDGTNDYFDTKRLRDESDAAEFRHKRLSNRDSSPHFDDRGIRYKDDRVKRKNIDREDYDDIRVWSSKEQHIDIEKKSENCARVESVGNRGRSTVHDADMDSLNHGRRGNSPSYRILKQEESRYLEYTPGGRERRDMTPAKEYTGVPAVNEKVSRQNERSIKKDGFGNDTSTERHLREDAPISSFHMVDKSPSSASNDRRNLRRADVEDSDQRSGASKEIKDYRGRDNRGNSELPNEIPQADNDNISVSSPFSKPNNFNNSNRSHLPPTPFRGGSDRPFDDENRGKQYRRRRMDSNIGRVQGNAWRGVPSWPSPVTNGFVPFQHGPPPLGFHPVMQQFPNTPIFGVRPSMELNQSGVPFHGHVRPLGWDGNSSIFGDESHLYGRLDWENNRNPNSVGGWENSRDAWKGQNSSVNAESQSVPYKGDLLAHRTRDENWPGKLSPPAQTDKKQMSIQVDIDSLSDVERDSPKEASKAISDDIPDPKTEVENHFSRAYLSMLDISKDLSQCEVYSQCTNLVGVDHSIDPDGDDSKLVIMEEDINALGRDSNRTSSASLFSAMNDSIFQKAMALYKKLKEEAMISGQDKVPSTNAEGVDTNDDQPMEMTPAIQEKDPEISVSEVSKVKIEASLGKNDEPSIAAPSMVKMEIDSDIKEELAGEIDNNGNEGENLSDGKSVPLPFSGASAEVGIEGVNECASVNLSRRLKSPESTH